MKSREDTITAVATASGRAGIGIVRISGPEAHSIAQRLTGQLPRPGHFNYTAFHDCDGALIDFGVLLCFQAPHSYTGEDVVEFQGHGGVAVLDILLDATVEAGARLAIPGEYTERAFLNDKIDLAQAEAIADLVESSNATAARAAIRSLSGVFSDDVHKLNEQLIGLRIYVEAALDFAEEEIDFLSDAALMERADLLEKSFNDILVTATQGQLLKEGMTLVIAGKPNVGKSSLLNALTGRDSAIVTDIAGTTRDVLREHIHLDGMPLHIVDTAGLHDTDDVVELEGIKRARKEISEADRILLVVDNEHSSVPEGDFPAGIPVDVIRNKLDLVDEPPGLENYQGGVLIKLSARTGDGVAMLKDHLKSVAGLRQDLEGVYMARARQVNALQRAATAATQAVRQLKDGQAPELAAQDLRDAQGALNEITGSFTNDDLLGKIFAGFCIGK